MNFAAAATPSTAANRSLPPLSGRLLIAYRLAWAFLAIGSVATLAWLILSSGMSPAILALRLAKGAVLIAVSTILFRRRQRDVVAGLLSSAFLLWSITSSFDVTSGQSPMAAMLADRLRFLLFALALLLFPNGSWSPRWTRHVAWLSAVVFAIGALEGLDWLHSRLFLPLAVLCVLAAIGSVFHRFRLASSATERQQSKWIALGLAAGILLILAARIGAAFEALSDPLLVEALYQLGIVTIAIGFLVSLLRYRLYDAEAVISRSAAYALLTVSVVATFAGSEALIEMLGQQYLGSGLGNVSAAMAAAVAAVMLAPLHNRITDWARQHFQRDLTDLTEHLPDLLAEFSRSSSPASIGQTVLPIIGKAVRADHLALIVDRRVIATVGIEGILASQWLEARLPADGSGDFSGDSNSNFPLQMPLLSPLGDMRGWLLLGPRPDGSGYSKDDLEALGMLKRPLRMALFAAREREVERKHDEINRRAMKRAISDLQVRLERLEA